MDEKERDRVLREAWRNIEGREQQEREHAEWLARHDPLQEDAAKVRRQHLDNPPMKVIRKVHINEPTHSSIYQASAPAPGPSERELVEVIGECFAIERRKLGETLRAEQIAELATLKSEIAELRGQVGVLLNLLSGGTKGDVVALPRRA
jgi:hypothetical protein